MIPNRELQVDLADRSYPILIGSRLLAHTGKMLAEKYPGARCAIISDENVMNLHGDTLSSALKASDIDAITITVPAGEKSKSMTMLDTVVDQLLAARLERNDLVIALGGGVVGDLAGFAAAIVRRGMDFVQIPTSLLAQVDSSVGGKTGINSPHGKNLIGAFHQPKLVIADTDLLRTLPKREFAAGYAEVAKYGLINKPDFFAWLERNRSDLFGFGSSLAEAIETSCRAKAEIVAEDETEQGSRALLNLGHTFGHALEAATGYDGARLVHGEGVAIGIVLAHRFSNRLNLCGMEEVQRVERHFQACALPTRISDIKGKMPGPEKLLEYIAQDKKVSRGKLTFILTKGLGQAYIEKNIKPEQVLTFLKEAVEL
jgi:3-dehydroquinate synthase